MRALVCSEPGRLTVDARPDPRPAAGQALVRVRRAGVCGTDLHIFAGDQPYLAYPRLIGHELAGEIVESGAGVALRPGAQVCVIPYLSCGTCGACRRGKTNCCSELAVMGVHVDGGMAEFVCVPEANAYPADDVSAEEAATAEFLAIGAHAVRRAAPSPGDNALVVGAGPIGVACAIFARRSGAEVTIVDLREDRLAFCADRLDFGRTVPGGDGVARRLGELTGGAFYDAVFDATGSVASMQASFGFVAHGGVLALVGLARGAISFSDPDFHKRETTLLACRNATREDFAAALDAIRDGAAPASALVTHRAALEDAPALFAEWSKPGSGVVKAMLEI
ncbi:MAG: zinc-binding alcohol dehydrogenase family protein [Hyphomicrobiales bacterium]|nr:zinc-binding alcohol dehydrogenase family protein [Hyphomicrobiales bacterium]MDE2016236.1 zinc-binding alcohol dehydrogenase family protein [Hyphomicrobiales bacterium]